MQLLESFYTVRFSDCDPFRHLNNARYIDYMLNAREDHLKENYNMDLASFYKKGMGWVVVKHEISYLRPASINERICIRSGLLESSADHLLVEMLMLDENTSHLKAILHTRFTPVSLTTGRKEPHASEFMDFIADKHLPGIPENFSLADRVDHWQSELKSLSNS
jgi:YbgC/YbaW family acyl-CoA thioester hydrolase